MSKRAAIYVRVSTDHQTVRNQERELRAVAAQRGWHVVHVYSDRGISGGKGRDERPGFDALCTAATRGQCDVIMAWSVDRLGRSLQDLIGFMSEVQAAGVGLFLHQQALDTTTPAGKAMFQMIGVFAEFERSLIRERVRAGLARARDEGKTLGRPRVDDATDRAVRKALRAGKSGILKIARAVGCGVGTVVRIRNEMAAAS